ncbi:MAG TPA: DUF3108 domain-containing protein [Parvibaculum sp.]
MKTSKRWKMAVLLPTTALALSLASRPAAAVPVPLPDPRASLQTATADHVEAEFTVYVGGFLFARGTMAATFEGADYRLKTVLSTAGLPRAFYEAQFKLASEGRLADAHVKPAVYNSDSWDKSSARKVTLSYDGEGMPSLKAVPPYKPGDLSDVMPYQQLGTQDPVSAALVPVVGGGDPCDRSIPVFDGRRRYDLQLSRAGEVKMTPRGLKAPVIAIACNIKYVPVAPIERKKFTEMLRQNDGMKVWLAPFNGGRVYMPVRLQLHTPLGGAVMELTHVAENDAAQSATAEAASK